jgi:hypothetical protein
LPLQQRQQSSIFTKSVCSTIWNLFGNSIDCREKEFWLDKVLSQDNSLWSDSFILSSCVSSFILKVLFANFQNYKFKNGKKNCPNWQIRKNNEINKERYKLLITSTTQYTFMVFKFVQEIFKFHHFLHHQCFPNAEDFWTITYQIVKRRNLL